MARALPTGSCSTAINDLPDVITDCRAKKQYVFGKLLGNGAFVKYYELLDKDTNATYAAAIISKPLLVKPTDKAKMAEEIKTHRILNNSYVLGLHRYLEGVLNVYIFLAFYHIPSLKEMLQPREMLTEVETRCLLLRLSLCFQYVAELLIVQRGFKLGNRLHNVGTEVFSKNGQGFEVDIWFMWRILYTNIVGNRPSGVPTVLKTYARIMKNIYKVNATVSSEALAFIWRATQPMQENRPSIPAVWDGDSMTCRPPPPCRPKLCLVAPPRLDTPNATITTAGRQPLMEKNELEATVTPMKGQSEDRRIPVDSLKAQPRARPKEAHVPARAERSSFAQQGEDCEDNLQQLQRLLQQLLSMMPPKREFERPEEVEDPAYMPLFWISKWVDESENCGVGHKLCDGSMSVIFNDKTDLTLQNNNAGMVYVDKRGTEHYHRVDECPPQLGKKISLLKHFRRYMRRNLRMTVQVVRMRERECQARLPSLRMWLRTSFAICFYLTNGTVQLNFFNDHTKLILCPRLASVTFIDDFGVFHTYRFATLRRGCPRRVLSRLQYASTLLQDMVLVQSSKPSP